MKICALLLLLTTFAQARAPVILTEESYLEQLTGKELRRYLYACSGELAITSTGQTVRGDILSATQGGKFEAKLYSRFKNLPREALPEQGFTIHTLLEADQPRFVYRGGSPVGLLYGVYRFIEVLGVRFFLHEVLPPKKPLSLPPLHLAETPAGRLWILCLDMRQR